MLYPQSVLVNEQALAKLTKTYAAAYQQIFKEIAGATQFGAARRRIILGQIQAHLEELGADTTDLIKTELPKMYEGGADDAVAQLKKIYAPVDIKTGFNRIHKEAIAALVDDTAKAFGESISGVNRSARQLMSQATKETLTQQLATGQISGDARKTIQKNLVATLQENGLDALVDKGGHGWTLDRYTEMLIRTKAVESRNTGLTNRLVENGYDLVQVSSHGANDACGRWEGKVLSLTGATKYLPNGEEVFTLRQAENDGLFHPNCKHAINALTLELARETMAWNSATRSYETGLIDL